MNHQSLRIFAIGLAACLITVLTGSALADVPVWVPEPPQLQGAPLVIRVDPNAQQPVLWIPKRLLAADSGPVPILPQPGPGVTRSVIAALALSCGIAALFLVRRDRKLRTAVALAVGTVALATAGHLMADEPAPSLRHRSLQRNVAPVASQGRTV